MKLIEMFGMNRNVDWDVDVSYGVPPDSGVKLIFTRGSEKTETPPMSSETAERIGRLMTGAAWDALHANAQHLSTPKSNLPSARVVKKR